MLNLTFQSLIRECSVNVTSVVFYHDGQLGHRKEGLGQALAAQQPVSQHLTCAYLMPSGLMEGIPSFTLVIIVPDLPPGFAFGVIFLFSFSKLAWYSSGYPANPSGTTSYICAPVHNAFV